MSLCLTVDVESWYDGMAELGHRFDEPKDPGSGLDRLAQLLGPTGPSPAARLTFFVVGNYAAKVGAELRMLVGTGHEVASHGPDHGALPEDPVQLELWLRRGREMVEDVVQCGVTGFRAPRFDVPSSMPLTRYREIIAGAGFAYASDRHRCAASPVRELPVLEWRGMPIGGGSYQRLLPMAAIHRLLRDGAASAVLGSGQPAGPVVLYYHSYDFGITFPSLLGHGSSALARQTLGRRRIPRIFGDVLARFGSTTCQQESHVV